MRVTTRSKLPHSRLREAICRVLPAEGFLGGVETSGEGYKKKADAGLALLATAVSR